MYSLYDVLTNQHGDEFAPVRCTPQTILRLVRYFEDVVTENKLQALVIQGRCLDGKEPLREVERISRLSEEARHLYLFSCQDDCAAKRWSPEPSPKLTLLRERDRHSFEPGPFILVMDPRFCGLLASNEVSSQSTRPSKIYQMVWTFEPNVVFTAIEYLMARINVRKPDERETFAGHLNSSTAHSPSLRLALSLTTKLTMLMQHQNELEMATNRISSAISSTLELESILQSAVEEVGRALKSHRAALVLWEDGTLKPEGMSIYERPAEDECLEPIRDLAHRPEIALLENLVGAAGRRNGGPGSSSLPIPGPLEAPITYRNSIIGTLVVEDDTPGRVWEDEEILMVKTASDQLAVAISHARLFQQVQTQAMTDELTGLFNHRYFHERLEREMKLADRNNDKVSLILLDLDHLKRINDSFGHRAGDSALRHVADMMRSTVRDVDICGRYGGEEFVVILPQCGWEDAVHVAERLREAIASQPLSRIGQLTASFGVTTYPTAAKSKEELIEMADRAMYLAKASGRNSVRTLIHHSYTGINR